QSKPQHILHLSEDQRRKFFDSFDQVVSDIDGVVCDKHSTFPGVPEGFLALQRIGKPLTFVTNNSVRTVDQAVEQFAKSGMAVRPEQIVHPAQTTVDYLKEIKFQGLIYVMASPQFKAILRAAGFQIIDGPNELIEDNYQAMAKKIFDDQPVKAVIMDVDFNLTSVKILRAQMYLRDPECLLIEGATDRMMPMGRGIHLIGPGPFTSILEEGIGRKAITVGKPGRELGHQLVRSLNIQKPNRVLMIGDMLAQDIVFGRQSGFQTLLVLSGGCKLEHLQAETDPTRIPDFYADSMADVATLLNQSQSQSHI
ncbi:hypothetical protein KR018_002380, partial [Drosophila ironensis]